MKLQQLRYINEIKKMGITYLLHHISYIRLSPVSVNKFHF